MASEDDYVIPDDEYVYEEEAPKAGRTGFAYGEDAEEVDLNDVDMDTVEVLRLRERLLRIGYVEAPPGTWTKTEEYECPTNCWEGFFNATPTSALCTSAVYVGIPGNKVERYVPWFVDFTVAQLVKVVRAIVTNTTPSIDGGRAVRAYNGTANLVDGEWIDDPDADSFAMPVTKRLASSAQMFCASVNLAQKDHSVKIEGYELPQIVSMPTLLAANRDLTARIDPLWKKFFVPLLRLPTDKGKKVVTQDTIRVAPFVWSTIGKMYDGKTVVASNIRSMSYYLFWLKDLYPIPALSADLDGLYSNPAPCIPKGLISRVISHSIWVGGFPTPGDAIIAKFLDTEYFGSAPFCGSFSKGVISHVTRPAEFEGPNMYTGNPDLEHGVKSIGSGNYSSYSGVYWNPTVAHMAHLTNIIGIAVPYTSAPGALAVAWDFIKTRCSKGGRVYVTYGANPVLWVFCYDAVDESGKVLHKRYKINTNWVLAMFKTCGWMSIVNFATSVSRGFYNPGQIANDKYLKQLKWCGVLLPDGKCEFQELEDDWVPGRWVDRVKGVDLNMPPDLWKDEEDEYVEPAAEATPRGKSDRASARRVDPDAMDDE